MFSGCASSGISWTNAGGENLQGAGLEVRALLGAPILAPPGAEDLALRALGALLSPTRALRTLCQVAAGALQVRPSPVALLHGQRPGPIQAQSCCSEIFVT